ncbi:hypothetical protein [Labedella endophytica]|uniref:Uncharacterized protein n=1 Tax=Labedella endophytica TaxID=1523160 RepID=A0A433JWD0_9MICO|nr:hypothetical protein [Labedella endophytica]RUR03315.1 hypothetical protein ELQ94_01830 [Labedella endophytica]
MSDVFGRHPGDGRLDAEVSAAHAARVHRRSRIAVWTVRVALAASLLLLVVAGVVLAREAGAGWPAEASRQGPLLAALALAVGGVSIVLAVMTARRTRRLLEASAPEGGVVLGMSSAGINLTHLPLLEWEAISAIGIAERAEGSRRAVTVGIAVADVGAARARIIDARLAHLVRPFPRSPGRRGRGRTGTGGRRRGVSRPEPGFLAVDLGDLLDQPTIDAVIARLRLESEQRDIPLHRTDDRRDLGGILRPVPSDDV